MGLGGGFSFIPQGLLQIAADLPTRRSEDKDSASRAIMQIYRAFGIL
jgi:hypothetical protein